MNTYMIWFVFGATVPTYLFLRLWQWLLGKAPGKLKDCEWRELLAFTVLPTYITALLLNAWGRSTEGFEAEQMSILIFPLMIPTTLAWGLEYLRQRRNEKKRAAAALL